MPPFFFRYLFNTLKTSSRSVLLIILIDLLPLAGVWWLGWDAFNLVFVYFVETFVLIYFTWMKMRRAKYVLAVLTPTSTDLTPDSSVQLAAQASQADDETVEESTDVAQDETPPTTDQQSFSTIALATRQMSWMIRLIVWLLQTFLWILRPIFGGGFLFLNLPLAWLQLYVLTVLRGDGFSPLNFLNHELGHLAFLPLLPLVGLMLVCEHWWFYRRNYIQKQEFENTGMINEGLRYQIRTIIQAFVMLAAVGLLISERLSFPAAVCLILAKVMFDVVGFIWNRAWGAATNKRELDPHQAVPA